MKPLEPNRRYKQGDVVPDVAQVHIAVKDNAPTPGEGKPEWRSIPRGRTNMDSFEPIYNAFNGYEAKKAAHKAKVEADRASALSKLEALGLTPAEIAAITNVLPG
jgi:hypothetical protein